MDNTFDLTRSFNRLIELCYQAVAVPLRVPQPRLRRLSRLLRVLQAGVPGDLRSGDREDGAGVEVDLFRPDDELRAPRPPWRSTSASPTRSTGDVEGTALAPSPPARVVVARLGVGRSLVQLLVRQRLLQQDRVWLDHPRFPFGFLRDYVRRVGGEDIDRPTEAIAAERDRITPSTGRCSRRRGARRSTRSSGSRGSCFPTSRTTTSTSSTGRCRSSGARSSRSARCCSDGFFSDRRGHLLRAPRAAAGAVRLRHAWAAGAAPGPSYWPPRSSAARRSSLHSSGQAPPPALDVPGGRHRAVHDHALGHHDGERRQWLGGASP